MRYLVSDAACLRYEIYSIYLLYEYKSTNTDAKGAALLVPTCSSSGGKYSIYLLY